MVVLWKAFCDQSTNTFPCRSDRAMVVVTFPGARFSNSDPTASAKPEV